MYVAFRFYGKMLTLSLTGKLRVQDQQLRLDADSGQFGSLPLPSLVLERAMRKVFDSLRKTGKSSVCPTTFRMFALTREHGPDRESKQQREDRGPVVNRIGTPQSVVAFRRALDRALPGARRVVLNSKPA